MTTTADIATQLETTFGLAGVELRYGLSQDELFHEAIAHDRGRVEIDGSDDAQKAFATSLGVDGPLVYFSDPECTGRPVKDTYCVNRPGTTSRVWWKDGFAKFDADAFDTLLPRVIDHLNERQRHLYVADVFCGWDPTFAEPYRFVGELAPTPTSATSCFRKPSARTATAPKPGGPSSTCRRSSAYPSATAPVATVP